MTVAPVEPNIEKASSIRILLTSVGVGALWGSGAGLIIASKGTGHFPWEAVFGGSVAIGVVLGAVVGGILVALRRQRSGAMDRFRARR